MTSAKPHACNTTLGQKLTSSHLFRLHLLSDSPKEFQYFNFLNLEPSFTESPKPSTSILSPLLLTTRHHQPSSMCRTHMQALLCPSCQKIFTTPEMAQKAKTYSRPHYEHTKFVESIYDARQRGCQICAMLCHYFNADPRNEPADQRNLQYEIILNDPNDHDSSIFALISFYYENKIILSSPGGYLPIAVHEDGSY